ncbi:hypothetical protein DPMN_144522 [Dreissena polymorpha]|uniref:Uncharacterized protein n=1 Tax=Dreissena polymorpha TaxID=45954 RepID=A0A9D4GIF4_DREPO|nr:hypothetical protein DPMN_144522 [Dreissena polymorpha]
MMYNVTELNHPSWHAAILVFSFITVGTMKMHQLYAFLRKHVVFDLWNIIQDKKRH